MLIVFVIVSCAGPNSRHQTSQNVVRQTGPGGRDQTGWVKRQDAFEIDRKECTESVDKNLNSESFRKAFEECMSKKGYQYQTSQNAVKRAAADRYGQTPWLLSQEVFEEDQKECTESIDKNLDSVAFGKALDECMDSKGYQFQTVKPVPAGVKVLAIAGIIVLLPIAVALLAVGGLLGAIR